MKRYWLFYGMTYYPNGGMKDFVNSFDDLEGAKEKGISLLEYCEWAQIYDSKKEKIILDAKESKVDGKRFDTIYEWKDFND